jgi:hypothetical protein
MSNAKSMTGDDVRAYCRNLDSEIAIDGNAFFYEDCELDGIVVRAPIEVRQMIVFIYSLIEIIMRPTASEGVVWLSRFDVGVLDTAYVGQRILEDMRLAHGDPASLKQAPAQRFGVGDKTELVIFLIQAITFGWPGHCLFDGGRFLINFTSSERWFFRARDAADLDQLRTALGPWNPSPAE